MKSDLQLHTFSLKKNESGYLFEFGQMDYAVLLSDEIGAHSLNGFLEFQKAGEQEFKQISINEEKPKSVISIINVHCTEWLLIRFDLVSDTGRIIEFYAGVCCVSFPNGENLLRYLKVIIPDESIAVTVYSYLINNIGGTVIYDEGRFSVMPAFDMEDLNRPISDENPFD